MNRYGRRVRPQSAVGVALFALAIFSLWLAVPSAARAQATFTDEFRVESCTWSNTGFQNPFFRLTPGYRLILEGQEQSDGETTTIELRWSVLYKTKSITFVSAFGKSITVNARVIEEREFEDGELVEVSRNWFARCVQTNDIFYFGEEVDNYEDGEIANHAGSWRAGANGALPGIIMPGTFLLGARYFQELAPRVALDRGENTKMKLRIATGAGTFGRCVEILDTNALDPGAPGDIKRYCPRVGLVQDEAIRLVEIETF
jgi:hypothetical protein